MPGEAELRAPPSARIEDAGLRWSRDAEGFVLERVPTVRGALRFALPALAFGGFGAFQVLRGGLLAGALLLALALLFALGVATVGRLGFRVVFRPDGSASWTRTGPRAGEGHWARGHVTATRVTVGRPSTLWGAHRTVAAEAEVRGRWVTLAWGFDRARASRLADDMSTALGLRREGTVETGL